MGYLFRKGLWFNFHAIFIGEILQKLISLLALYASFLRIIFLRGERETTYSHIGVAEGIEIQIEQVNNWGHI